MARSWCLAPTLLCLFIIVAPTSTAIAFDSAEHCGASNLALLIAFDYVTDRLESTRTPAADSYRTVLNKAKAVMLPYVAPDDLKSDSHPEQIYCLDHYWPNHVSTIPPSYGKIVALVDFTLDPKALFKSNGEITEVPKTLDELNQEYWEALPKNTSGIKGNSERPHDFQLMLRYFQASHNNPRHFQGEAIDSFFDLHIQAINAARSDSYSRDNRSMVHALAYNAIADHFLEDSLAPGHIITPRDGMYDGFALSWHDAYNERGRAIAVRNWQELDSLWNFLVTNQSRYDQYFRHVGDLRLGEMTKTPIGNALNSLRSQTERETCSHRGRVAFAKFLDADDKLLDLFPDDLPNIDSAKSVEQTPPGSRLYVCMHGDGSLNELGSGSSDEVSAQKALMIIIEAKYIIEVLAAFGADIDQRVFGLMRPVNTVDDYKRFWCPEGSEYVTSDEILARKQDIRAHGGSWPVDCQQLMITAAAIDCPSIIEGGGCRVTMIPTAVTRYFAYVSSPSSYPELVGGTIDPLDYLYELSAGAISNGGHSNGVLGLEYGPAFYRGSGAQQIYAAFGIKTQIGAAARDPYAITLRYAFQVPAIDLQYGIYGEMDDVGNGITHRERSAFGLRLDQGFSLASMFLTLGWQPQLYNPVHTVRTFAIGAGISFIFNGRELKRDVQSWAR